MRRLLSWRGRNRDPSTSRTYLGSLHPGDAGLQSVQSHVQVRTLFSLLLPRRGLADFICARSMLVLDGRTFFSRSWPTLPVPIDEEWHATSGEPLFPKEVCYEVLLPHRRRHSDGGRRRHPFGE